MENLMKPSKEEETRVHSASSIGISAQMWFDPFELGERIGTLLLRAEITDLAKELREGSLGFWERPGFSDHHLTEKVGSAGLHFPSIQETIELLVNPSGSAAVHALVDAMILSMSDRKAPISAAAEFVRGVHSIAKLGQPEIDAIFDASLLRLTDIAVDNGAMKATAVVSTAIFHDLRRRLQAMNLQFCRAILHSAAGLEALPGAESLKSWLYDNRHAFHPVLDKPLARHSTAIIPFGDASHAIARLSAEARPAEAEAAWQQLADAAGVEVGIGPWGEVRSVYTSAMFNSKLVEGARRTIHLGLDLFMPARTKLYCPYPGTVRGIDIERDMLSYGCLVTILHEPKSGPPFLSLWGHLAHEAASRLSLGQPVAAGSLVGEMGDHIENGGWAPHLHLQICVDTTLSPVEVIGVGEEEYLGIWSDIFPSAYDFAGLSDGQREGTAQRT